MFLLILVLAYLLLTVPALRWLVRTANRAGWGWDYLLVLACCLGWLLGWGIVGAWVLVWMGVR